MVVLSLLAALAFAVGAVLQQHAAARQPPERHMRPALVVGLLRRPLWLAGVAANGVGTLLQLAALWRGSLVAVQPLLVCGLLFALPINSLVLRRRLPGWRECASGAVVCLGLALFLLATDPSPGTGTTAASSWGIALSLLFACALVLVLAAGRASGPLRPGLLAVAAGAINGLSAAFIKGVARLIRHDIGGGVLFTLGHAVRDWEFYGVAVTLVLATLLVQSAYQIGPIRWSLPALTAANPVTSVLLGAMVLSEQVRTTPISLAGAVVGLGLVVSGILTLSSSSLIDGEPAPVAPAPFAPRRRSPTVAPDASEQASATTGP